MADFNRNRQNVCSVCGQVKANSTFTASPVKHHNSGLLPICNKCCNALLKEYTAQTGDSAAGFWCLCAELGIPFIYKYYMSVQDEMNEKSGGRKPDIVPLYVNELQMNGVDCVGFWQSDKMLTDFVNTGTHFKDAQENIITLKDNKKIWGNLPYTDTNELTEAYDFLNETFDQYTSGIDPSEEDANLLNRYRDLCKAELRKRKADESGDIQEIKNAQAILNDMLKLLNMNDFSKHDGDERRKFIDRIAWMIEETEPAEEEDEEKYRDIAGYEKIYNSWMRSMQNLICGSRDYPDVPKEEM